MSYVPWIPVWATAAALGCFLGAAMRNRHRLRAWLRPYPDDAQMQAEMLRGLRPQRLVFHLRTPDGHQFTREMRCLAKDIPKTIALDSGVKLSSVTWNGENITPKGAKS